TLATMQLADSFELAYVRMIIAAVAGVLIVSVGSRGIRSGSFVSRSGGMNRLLLWMTTAGYAVSWFLPVVKDGWTIDDGLPGWEALTVVMTPIWEPRKFIENPLFSSICIVTGLTNAFMIIALVRLHGSRRPIARAWKRWAWVAAAITASWIGFDW